MKKNLVLVIIAVVCLVIGAAGGFVASNMKSKTVIADLQKQMKDADMMAQDRIRNYDNMVSRITSQLQLANTELETLKAANANGSASSSTTPAAMSAPSTPSSAGITTTPANITSNAGSENTRDYKIQSGDSLWIIAQKQLGNGNRYKEILKLNPKISEKGNLVVGSSLKLPAK